MLIGKELNEAINRQIGNEFAASMQYISIAGYFETVSLTLLSKLFFEQAEEENAHAMKFVHYILETDGELRIPALSAPKASFSSAEEAVEAALNWEIDVTGQINNLVRIAMEANDYLGQTFLQWYVTEQLEEVAKMQRLLDVVRRAGERNLLMVEAYLAHVSQS